MRQTLPLLYTKLKTSENEFTMAFLEKAGGKHHNHITSRVLGRVVHKKLSMDELNALITSGYHVTDDSVPTFQRYKEKDSVYISRKPQNKRDSSVCMIRMPSKTFFGSIKKLCYVDATPVAIIAVYKRVKPAEEDILQEPRHQSYLQSNDHKAARCINSKSLNFLCLMREWLYNV